MSILTTSVVLYAAFLVFSSAVNAMSPPHNSAGFYGWLYRFLRLITANVTESVESRYHISLPGTEIEQTVQGSSVQTKTQVNP